MRRRVMIRKEQLYSYSYALSNIVLVFSVAITAIYFIMYIAGGEELSIVNILQFGIWILVVLWLRYFCRRVQNRLETRIFDFLIGCIITIAGFILWFSFPANIILIVLSMIGFACSYKAHRKGAKGGRP